VDIVLELFSENLIQYFEHLVPERGLFISQVGRHKIYAFIDLYVLGVPEMDVGSAVGCGERVHFYYCLAFIELLWVQDVEDSERVVKGRIGNFVRLDIEILVDLYHLINCFAQRDVRELLDSIVHVLGAQVLMSYFKWDHDQRDVGFQLQDLLKGAGIEEDVEFSCWGAVALSNCASHHHYIFYF
jgi:hypothetical protein